MTNLIGLNDPEPADKSSVALKKIDLGRIENRINKYAEYVLLRVPIFKVKTQRSISASIGPFMMLRISRRTAVCMKKRPDKKRRPEVELRTMIVGHGACWVKC